MGGIMNEKKTREEALTLARRLYKLANHPTTPEAEKMSAQEKLYKIQKQWEFTDTEVSIDPDNVEGEDPPEVGEAVKAWSRVLHMLNLTEDQFHRLLGELVADLVSKGLGRLVSRFLR